MCEGKLAWVYDSGMEQEAQGVLCGVREWRGGLCRTTYERVVVHEMSVDRFLEVRDVERRCARRIGHGRRGLGEQSPHKRKQDRFSLSLDNHGRPRSSCIRGQVRTGKARSSRYVALRSPFLTLI